MSTFDRHILFLDDDENRHEIFKEDTAHLTNDFIVEAFSYSHVVEIFNRFTPDTWDIVFLDHDLGVEDQMCIPDVTNRFPTGSDVARYMVENGIKAKKIIIHSYNSVGAANMINIFKEVGVTAIYHPFDAGLKEYLYVE